MLTNAKVDFIIANILTSMQQTSVLKPNQLIKHYDDVGRLNNIPYSEWSILSLRQSDCI